MSVRHPIIAITGSSGAGTTSVMRTFEQIFLREGVTAAYIEGDSFHRFDREEMKQQMAEARARGNEHYSHFGPESNLFEELATLFKGYGENGRGSAGSVCTTTTRRGHIARSRGPSRRGRRCRPTPTSSSTKDCTVPSSPSR
jgi:phosphoribulokinase